uniref:C1q domain-containing protein n=1 Tax=Anopheles atroparvus TaxID=41427 RepID=A0AAG5DH61_ANOAO
MARQSASISSSPGCRTVLLQLLVRLLLVGLVLLIVLEPTGAEGGSVAGGAASKRMSTVDSAAEEDDGSAAVAGSDELLEEESFEQGVTGASRKANDSGERETVTVGLSREDPVSGGTETTTLGYNAVATTPKIVEKPVKKLSRYEQGLEDYDEAADRAEREQKEQLAGQQYNNMLKPMLTLFNVISTVLSSGRSMRSKLATDGGNKNENITFGAGKSTSGADNENALATVEGRYIKGDPLNGYYDFVISEGSYKFWAVFQ